MLKEEHLLAQEYEFSALSGWIDGHYDDCMRQIKINKYWPGARQGYLKIFFDENVELWLEFAQEIENETCLEIGSGIMGAAVFWSFVKDWHVIDPLVQRYKDEIMLKFGESPWRKEINTHAVNAEELVPELINQVTGAIICRNCLDHTADPYGIVKNFGIYAAPGCKLLLWTDLYHLNGHDEGHTDITQNPAEFQQFLEAQGFRIIRHTQQARTDNSTLEYGCVAEKVQGFVRP